MAIAEAPLHFHPNGPLVALVGNPNCGKTALFNRLTGGRQHVANYAGVTVERKEGKLLTDGGKLLRILDLPGVYSLYPRSPDEKVTADVLAGRAQGEKRPDVVVCVVDATNLRRSLRLVLAVQRTGIPCMLALNLMDEARAAASTSTPNGCPANWASRWRRRWPCARMATHRCASCWVTATSGQHRALQQRTPKPTPPRSRKTTTVFRPS